MLGRSQGNPAGELHQSYASIVAEGTDERMVDERQDSWRVQKSRGRSALQRGPEEQGQREKQGCYNCGRRGILPGTVEHQGSLKSATTVRETTFKGSAQLEEEEAKCSSSRLEEAVQGLEGEEIKMTEQSSEGQEEGQRSVE